MTSNTTPISSTDDLPRVPSPFDPWQRWLDYGLAFARFDWTALDWAVPRAGATDLVTPPATTPAGVPAAPGETDWTTVDWVTVDWDAIDWSAGTVPTETQHPSAPASPTAPATRTAARPMTLHAYREATPGPRWGALLDAVWPAYRNWYFSQGDAARPSLDKCRASLEQHMPELVPTWEAMMRVAESTGEAERVGRMLSMWCPPAFAGGCSQIALSDPEPVLIRNYDWDPALFECVIASTAYRGTPVIGTSDCLWGLVDGMNGNGLAISLTIGGRPGHGRGFAIPLVVRYLLETCSTVDEAVERLRGIPVAQAYNLTFVDASGAFASAFVAPGEEVEVSQLRAVTNHRLTTVENPAHARVFTSVERQQRLFELLEEGASAPALVEAQLASPMRTLAYDAGFGTLYTAEYRPASGTVTYHWPDRTWTRRFDDADEVITVDLAA